MENKNRNYFNSLPVPVWDTLGKFLDLEDFLKLRLVNKTLFAFVNECHHFQAKIPRSIWVDVSEPDKCVLQHEDPERQKLKSRNVNIMFRQNESEINHNGMSIPISDYVNKRTIVVHLKEFVEDPTWRLSYHRPTVPIALMPQSVLESILNGTPNLQSLSVNGLILAKVDIGTGSFDQTTGIEFTKLQEFKIYIPTKSKLNLCLEDRNRLTTNITFLCPTIKNLQKINVVGFKLLNFSDWQWGFFNDIINSILLRNVSTLHTIELSDPECWKNCCTNVTFPQLKCLRMKGRHEYGWGVATFLDNQPMLRCLDIAWTDYFPKCVFEVMNRKSKHLKTLSIKASFGLNGGTGDWNFLSEMTLLEDFQIKSQCAKERYFDLAKYNTILEKLPKSRLQRLFIRGLPDNDSLLTTKQLFKFQNLTELSLLRCKSAITDSVMKEMTLNWEFRNKITVFEISCCEKLTNAGLTGIGFFGVGRERSIYNHGFSINNWIALQKLSVTSCSLLTDDAFEKLKMPNLKCLDISNNQKVTRAGVLKVVKNNNNLESFCSSWEITREIMQLASKTGNKNLEKIRLQVSFNENDMAVINISESDAETALHSPDW